MKRASMKPVLTLLTALLSALLTSAVAAVIRRRRDARGVVEYGEYGDAVNPVRSVSG